MHPKTLKTPRKNNIFRLDLSTEDAAIEKPVANVSFYLNKTHIFEINSDITQRAHGPHRARLAHSCRTCVPYFVDFHHARKITSPRQKKKRGKYAEKKRRIFFDENRYALLNVTKRLHGKSKTTFIDMVGTTRPAPTGSGPEFFGAAGIPLAVAAVAGVNVDHRGHGCFCE